MCILARMKNKTAGKGGSGAGGFVREFVSAVYKPLMDDLAAGGVKVVTNAGALTMPPV